MSEPSHNNRESWGGWISNKVATAEAALSTAFVEQPPTRSRSFHNLRAVAKANRLATLRQQPDDEEEVLPPLTRRASAIDVTLSHAWHAVKSAAVAAMATFDEPVQPTQQPTQQPPAGVLCASTDALTAQLAIPEKAHFDTHTEISDVTTSASCSSADFSEHNQLSSTSHVWLGDPSSPSCENARISTTSCNHHINPEHVVLTEMSNSASSVADNGESDREDPDSRRPDRKGHNERDREDEHASCHEISEEQLKRLIDDFNTMFEQNGGAECVARVKQIGDKSLETMREPQSLNEAVEKELNNAKLKLDDTLQRLECAARSKESEYSDDCDASIAARGVIEETKENKGCGSRTKRNATLLQDCIRLVAVFASKMCACVLDRVESDKAEITWNERVDEIENASARGIRELQIVGMRFVEGVEGDGKNLVDTDDARDCKGRIDRVADAGVEQIVQCVALAVAALQAEMCERAYELCG